MHTPQNLYSNYQKIRKSILTGKNTSLSIVKSYLKIIKALNPEINAFIEIYENDAQNQAKKVDEKIKKQKQGKLAGLVVGIKDNILMKGKEITASSKILKGFISPFNSTAVERLISEDAIVIGRLNCDEFGMGSSNENSFYGSVKNPLDITKVPGGSSGGPAAAVAAGMCMAALGTDTGGSIRQPASFCGTVGLKPTYGSVSRHGCIAYASSLDQIGIISKNVEDCKRIFDVIAGKDLNDSTSSSIHFDNKKSKTKANESFRIGILESSVNNDFIDKEIKESFQKFTDKLRAKKVQVGSIDMEIKHLPSVYYTLTSAEAATNLQRYDGVHYGHSSNSAEQESIYVNTRTTGFGKEPKKRIMLGNYLHSKKNGSHLYSKALILRCKIINDAKGLFDKYDFLITPTTFETAFPLNSKHNSPEGQYYQDIFLVLSNLTGLPAISLPLFSHSNGLPFGLQLITNKFSENQLFTFSKYLMSISGSKNN